MTTVEKVEDIYKRGWVFLSIFRMEPDGLSRSLSDPLFHGVYWRGTIYKPAYYPANPETGCSPLPDFIASSFAGLVDQMYDALLKFEANS